MPSKPISKPIAKTSGKFKPLPKCQTEKEALEQIRKALPSSFDKVKKLQVVGEEDVR